MATRAFARTGTDFHDEPSIRQLTMTQQWAYELVLKRPDLSRCGVVAYTPRRWAKFADDATEHKLRKLYAHLVSTRHVVIDEDTEELFARTYVRHDGLLTQPNVVAAMVSDYRLINSDTIRTAFLIEMRRIWDIDFGPELDHKVRGGWLLAMGHYPPATEDGSVRFPDGMKAPALAALRRAVGPGLSVEMREAINEHSVRPFDQGSEKGSPQPFTEGPRGRVDASPAPSPPPYSGSGSDAVAASTPGQPDEGAPRRSGSTRDHLLDVHQAELGPLPAITAKALSRHLNAAPADAADSQLLTALAEWRRRPDAKPGLLPHLIGDQLTRPAPPNPDDPLAGLDPDARAWVEEQQAKRAGAAR